MEEKEFDIYSVPLSVLGDWREGRGRGDRLPPVMKHET